MTADAERLYFRQLLAGRDFATDDPLAHQMLNFVYVIGDRETSEAVVVDPAYDVEGILEVLDADGMRLAGVLATHYHPDHIGGEMMGFRISGIREMQMVVEHPVPVHIQTEEEPWIKIVTELSRDEIVGHVSGDTIMVGSIPVEVIHTPGHTPGSQCFYVAGCLVAGDTLFLDGCGRTDLPGGDARALYETLTQRLARIPDEAVLFPGHRYSPEPSGSMGETRRRNYVFRPRSEAEWLSMMGAG